MNSIYPYIHRDLSWLSFNYRVLQEAKDPTVPLFDRVKFLAIYSSNLDEFFRVRVANIKNLIKVGKKTQKSLDFEPKELLKEILATVNAQQEEFSITFKKKIVPELRSIGINLLRRNQLNDSQLDYIENYFHDNLIPYVQPLILLEKKVRPFLNNGALYLIVHLEEKEKPKSKVKYGVVKIPSDYTNRFVELPDMKNGERNLILLDDIIRHCLQFIFPGFDFVDSYSIKLTRDAELYIDDEFEGDLIAKIKKSLSKRNVGPASRLVYDRAMPKELLSYLQDVFELAQYDLLPEGRYHNNADFFKFLKYGKEGLAELPIKELRIPEIEGKNIFSAIDEKDYLLHVPFHSYKSVVNFFERAAVDPKVTHIKIIQYRVAKVSRIMDALIKAVKNGKQVTAFIEIKARFDEEANLEWGERLEAKGVKVLYSMPGLKVHSKMAIVRRQVDKQEKFYAYFSTGNFHEDTAKVYSDLGLFTANEKLTIEALRVFNYLETKKRPSKEFEYLSVGTFELKSELMKLVRQEIKNAEAGKPAWVTLKMNSLQDREMINLLYDASHAGVKITLIIRGICCIIPGIEGVSDKIEAFGILDRFLEHARVFMFCNNNKELVYISSSDWMVRNLHHRIETMVPILDPDIKRTIIDIIEIQKTDNVKSRRIHYKKNNSYKKTKSELPVRSQMETYFYLNRQAEEQNLELE